MVFNSLLGFYNTPMNYTSFAWLWYQCSLLGYGLLKTEDFYKLLQSLNVLIVYFWKITDLSRICDLLISDSSLTVLKSNILTLNHSFLHFPCSSRQMLIFNNLVSSLITLGLYSLLFSCYTTTVNTSVYPSVQHLYTLKQVG